MVGRGAPANSPVHVNMQALIHASMQALNARLTRNWRFGCRNIPILPAWHLAADVLKNGASCICTDEVSRSFSCKSALTDNHFLV